MGPRLFVVLAFFVIIISCGESGPLAQLPHGFELVAQKPPALDTVSNDDAVEAPEEPEGEIGGEPAEVEVEAEADDDAEDVGGAVDSPDLFIANLSPLVTISNKIILITPDSEKEPVDPPVTPAMAIDDAAAPWLVAYELSGSIIQFGSLAGGNFKIENDVQMNWGLGDKIVVVNCDTFIKAKVSGSKNSTSPGSVGIETCIATQTEGDTTPEGIKKGKVVWRYFSLTFSGFTFQDPCFGTVHVGGKVWSSDKTIDNYYELAKGVQGLAEAIRISGQLAYTIDGEINMIEFTGLNLFGNGALPLGPGDFKISGETTMADFDYTEAPEKILACWKD